MSRNLFLGAALLFFAVPALADVHPNTAGGFPVDQIFNSGGIDNVNLFNGALTLTIPIGQGYPVNGFSYGLKLVYNSSPWQFQEVQRLQSGVEVTKTQALPSQCSNAGLGWRLSLGRFNPECQVPDGFTVGEKPIYQDEMGSDHIFYPTLHEGDLEDVLPPGVLDVRYTRDSSFMRLKVKPGGIREVEEPNGTVRIFNASGWPIEIRDAFGNKLTITYGPNLWTLTDSVGRTHRVLFRSDLPGYAQTVSSIELQSFGGTAVYTFNYHQNATIGRLCPHNDNGLPGSVGPTVSVPFLTSVTLPDGSTYSTTVAEYVSTVTPGDCTDHSGNIRGLTLRSLGRLEWTWQTYYFPTGSSQKQRLQSNSGVATRQLRDMATPAVVQQRHTYAQSPPVAQIATAREIVTSVTDLANVRREHFFSTALDSTTSTSTWSLYDYSLPFTRNTTQVSSTGTTLNLSTRAWQGSALLRSEFVLYERENPATALGVDRFNTNRRLKQSRSRFFDDPLTPWMEDTLSDYDGLGHYRGRTTAGNFPGNNVRTSFTGYNPANVKPASEPWVLGTYSFAWESEGSQLVYRSFCFDSLGFLLGRRIHGANGASYQANDLVEVFVPMANGNVQTEKYFGGDTQATIPTTAGGGFICALTNSLANPTYQVDHTYQSGVRSRSFYTVGGVQLNVLDQTLHASTGLPTSSRDSAGAQTTYSYDLLGRLSTVTPPTGATTGYTYSVGTSTAVPAQVEISTNFGTNFGLQRITYDAFGRVSLEEDRMPNNNWSPRRTTYLPVGYKGFVSEKGTQGFGTTFLSYDPFGRPLTIRPADGGAHDVTLAYKGVREIKRTSKVATAAGVETDSTTTELYDRFGRLFEVEEPNLTKTRYEYDAANRLKKVCQGVGAGGACTQTRFFTYDNRGFLTSEQHPEKGATGNGTVSYFNYDARGHARRKVDGPNDLTFSYDAAERLTQIRETGGLQRVLKSFTYGTANSGADRRKGKVVSASRFNFVVAPFNATVEVRDTYVYAGLGGRTSQKDTQMHFNGAPKESFRQTFIWNEVGDLSLQSYPVCTATALCGTSTPRNVTNLYTRGRLTAVPGYASAITYHDNGLIHQVTHANTVVFTQQIGANSMARPTALTAVRTNVSPNQTHWTSGAYSYDGTGNIKAIGTETYLYDSLSRVVSAQLPGGAFQLYTFDPYGNITSTNTNGLVVNSPTTASTNRLFGALAYDGAGNLISWNANGYAYDAFNQLIRLWAGGGAEDWRYIYDAADERFWSYRVGGGASLWSLRDLSGKTMREFQSHAGWGTHEDYIYRGSTVLAGYLSSGVQRHFDVDHLGTIRLVTDAAGAQVAFHRYYPFGKEQTPLQEADRRKWAGHERDLANPAGDGDDLDYMHARHYNPVVGRFMSYDPMLDSIDLSEPRGWNRYAYVLANPIRYADPTGLDLTCITNEKGETHCSDDTTVTTSSIEIESFEVSTSFGVGVLPDPSVKREDSTRAVSEGGMIFESMEQEKGCSVFDSAGNCLGKCALDQFGLRTLLGTGSVAAGAPLLKKRFGGYTSVASKGLSTAFPQSLSRAVWVPTLKNPAARTRVLGRALGRAVPYVGWALLAVDAFQIADCAFGN